jgi:hypothetical protein
MCIVAIGDAAQTALFIAYKYRESVHKLILVGASARISEHAYKAFTSPIADTSLWADHKRQIYVDVYGDEGLQRLWTNYIKAKKMYI